ncbi:hypothetical protein BU23DRAFT_555770 [Bimuria novae-zelandiae CBS 107.79]|uniref:Uncharacterized protein n=1 Tax=Bimuria novae-zelandiae CBS 107.79 TaxID=1447943 RepID=A0A6A5V6D5_9PLEO|nr:hypothetical protein BU23DRAFT_555770 [Bimuria novae-zelandiae CBS 107.79]
MSLHNRTLQSFTIKLRRHRIRRRRKRCHVRHSAPTITVPITSYSLLALPTFQTGI